MNNDIQYIKNNKTIALLAPSFPIDFEYPAIIGMLRELGFDQVTELTFGARMVNWNYVQYIKENPDQKLYIASPCPTVVTFIETQYPDMVKFLMPIASPMLATTRIYRKHHPDHKVVFISPCFAKQKIEAPKYKDEIDLVITFSELKEMFKEKNIIAEHFNREYFFDSLVREFTKIYPISGGLGSTSHIGKLFSKEEILVTDGISNIKNALDEIKIGKKHYRFLDILNCLGGCIGGPATDQNINTEMKKEKIRQYMNKTEEHPLGAHEGKVENAKNVDLSIDF